MKKKPSLYALVDIPEGILQDFTMEIYSDKEIIFTGKCEITELSDSVLKIKSDEHRIFCEGNDLQIKDYTENGVRIVGEITGTRFERDETV